MGSSGEESEERESGMNARDVAYVSLAELDQLCYHFLDFQCACDL